MYAQITKGGEVTLKTSISSLSLIEFIETTRTIAFASAVTAISLLLMCSEIGPLREVYRQGGTIAVIKSSPPWVKIQGS